jgi:hypothetical protein
MEIGLLGADCLRSRNESRYKGHLRTVSNFGGDAVGQLHQTQSQQLNVMSGVPGIELPPFSSHTELEPSISWSLWRVDCRQLAASATRQLTRIPIKKLARTRC